MPGPGAQYFVVLAYHERDGSLSIENTITDIHPLRWIELQRQGENEMSDKYMHPKKVRILWWQFISMDDADTFALQSNRGPNAINELADLL